MDIKKEDQKEINKTNLDEEISESGEGSNPSSMENSENEDKQIEVLLEENKKLNDLFLRSKAELDNFQKRTVKQIQQAQQYSVEKLSSELLVIIDSLEAAASLSEKTNLKIDDFIEGNNLLLKTTKEIFEKLDIEEIDPKNEDFDPEYHQAMSTRESDKSNNKVLEVLQKGYKLKTKLLRPALVIVSKKN